MLYQPHGESLYRMPRTHDAGLSHAPPPHMTSKLHPCQRAGLVRHASDNNRGVPHGCAARRATTVAALFVNCERAFLLILCTCRSACSGPHPSSTFEGFCLSTALAGCPFPAPLFQGPVLRHVERRLPKVNDFFPIWKDYLTKLIYSKLPNRVSGSARP